MKREGKDVLTRDGDLRFDDKGRLGNSRGDLVEPPSELPRLRTTDFAAASARP